MKAKKIISVFLILIFTGCFWVTAFAADQPLFLPDNGGTYVNPPSVIGGQGNTYYSGNTQSVFGSSGDTLIGGPLDSASTGGFVPPVTQAASIAPEITKHPGSEDKKTGESTSFIARAYPYDNVYWMAIDPNGEHVAVDSIGDKITGVTFTGTHSEQLFINNVTDAINGWKFYAVFSNNFGNFGVMLRAYSYILSLGAENIKMVGPLATLNANYIKEQLKDVYCLPIDGLCKHEFVFDGLKDKSTGVTTMDVAKRLLDYGYHAPTIYFPLLFHESLMIEPTENESKETIDGFIAVMRKIAEEAKSNPEEVKSAPHNTPIGRVDDVLAAKNPVLTWKQMNA